MSNRFSFVMLVMFFTAAAAAQEKTVTAEDFVGTWSIEVMSHHIALVIDKQDATHVTATMMMMGRDLPLTGTLVDRTLTLTGVKAEGDAHAAAQIGHGSPQAPAKPIVVTLQDDGTLAGEMMTNQGPVKWTAEKLKTRKKPQ